MPAAQEPLARQIASVQFTDSEIKRIMQLSAAEVGNPTTAAGLRSMQKGMANEVLQAWGSVGDAVKVGIGDAAYNALEYQALFDEELFKSVGMQQTYWRQSMIATSQQGIQNLISRKVNGITLSQRVWKSGQASQKALNDTINVGLALNKSPQEIANDVKQYLRPDVPGGASSAALRLGRSEVLNAYHTTSVRKYMATPWIDRVKWNLSGSHPRPDECNEYSELVTYTGGEAGVWKVTEVPGKPHPNCLCFVTPIVIDLDDYVKNFKAGQYDDYIDKQMGCFRGA